ncbi:DUF4190 domain-containing protein [Mycolicibacterium rufum]|uniref:DUF4190 domain-containing protein n=1 Tax=Mycolicibacterium rufum TaxID=318424 RepID=A0A9X2YHD3_9MYCO|nr:DUF4190 domain-containing protein [Mycolicibacterium rufum]KGI68189.1 hypothetical protein EU78_12950 [Mycolicibacterium rufum]MCV7073213.1 DUF4190 domain-containing protein [Mycolicibacterium rufum]ULP39220.1 DUF4190 domain-containing protein [Mycolicibacterium rufum]
MSEPPPPPYGPNPGSYPPPPPQYGGYGGYPVPPPASVPRNGLGTTALILAIIGIVLCWSIAGGIILGLCAVIIGFVARGRVKRGEATNGGVAIAGIVLGVVAIIAALVFIPIYIGLFDQVGGTDYVDCLSRAGNDTEAAQQCADEFTQRVEDQFSITVTPTP